MVRAKQAARKRPLEFEEEETDDGEKMMRIKIPGSCHEHLESEKRRKVDPNARREHGVTPTDRPPVPRRTLTNSPPSFSTSYASSGGTWGIILQFFPSDTIEDITAIFNLQLTCHEIDKEVRSMNNNTWKNIYLNVFSLENTEMPDREEQKQTSKPWRRYGKKKKRDGEDEDEEEPHLPCYGEFWDSAFVHPKLSITSSNCWKNRLIHRIWLQKYRTPLRDIDQNYRGDCEIGDLVSEDPYLRDVDCFTLTSHVAGQEPDTTPHDEAAFVVVIGPSTLPIYFRVQYESDWHMEADWFLQLSAYSFRAHSWKPFYRVFACFCCDEDEGENYPLGVPLSGLVWGLKTNDLKNLQSEFSWRFPAILVGLVSCLGSVPVEQMHANTTDTVKVVDSDEEDLE